MQKHLELLPAEEYYNQLIQKLRQASDRIVVCAMTVEFGPKLGVLLDLIDEALARNVKVEMVFDSYSLSRLREGQLWKNQTSNETVISLKTLKNKGAVLTFVGKVGANPFAHRMHIKAMVIDDDLYAFGGLNFKDVSFEHQDYMIHSTDQMLLNRCLEVIKKVKSGEDLPDKTYRISPNESILFDGGIPGKSLIYETACRLAEEAEEIVFVSRMSPGGRLAKTLAQKTSRLYFNRPSAAHFPTNLSIVVDSVFSGLHNDYKSDTYLHSKFMLFRNKNGNKYFLSGSHNFSWLGVKFGTKEMALLSTDEYLWNMLWEYSNTLDS